MKKTRIGISDLALYIPSPRIELDTIVDARTSEDPELEKRLRRAVESTGQRAIRFPEQFEDNASLAGNAAYRLLSKRSPEQLKGLRYLAVGTETTVDFSKPISAYVEGMLQRSGMPVPNTLSSFQVQHACAGGTIALMSVAAMLALSNQKNESGVVICSDIARYDAPSTAEITQGAGSAAILVEADPKLLELDLETQGYSSRDVDDFFRPIGSVTAKVKGQYSMKCYHEAAEEAFLDHCSRVGKTPSEVLDETDYYVFHVPFARMAYTAARHLLSEFKGLDETQINEYLRDRSFFNALETTADIGNIYTGSAYLNLISILHDSYLRHGDKIVGKKILISSYGSGNTMIVLSATIAEQAPQVIASWDMNTFLNHSRNAAYAEYIDWTKRGYDHLSTENYQQSIQGLSIPNGVFFLQGIRNDGYREYQYKN